MGIIWKWPHCSHSGQNRTKNLSQPFKELQGSNSEFKLITPKSITGAILGLFWAHFGTHFGGKFYKNRLKINSEWFKELKNIEHAFGWLPTLAFDRFFIHFWCLGKIFWIRFGDRRDVHVNNATPVKYITFPPGYDFCLSCDFVKIFKILFSE